MKTIESAVKQFDSLYSRWLDEQEYEDFEEYKKVMDAALPEGACLTKMTKRPFMCEFTMLDGKKMWMKATSRNITVGEYVTN